MRTLKKVLALTIALATLFSLTAFAGYTDEEQINEKLVEDVNLMGALNVMTGDTEGTFRPNATISRAEAAKMVYVVRNGGVDDKAAGWTNMKTFSDVASGIWYEGYVNYCASLGIIAGVGNGKFNPDGAVTGVELAKMLLVVAGYKPDVQGYTGANWASNVINDAQLAGLFDDYSVAFSASAPRQWAAKLFSNAVLKAEMAVYFNGELINGVGIIGTKNVTVGEKYFGLKVETGDATANFYASLTGGLTNLKYSMVGSDKITYNVPTELLGQEVKVIYKESGDLADLDEKDEVYSVYATGATRVVETTKDAATVSGKTLKHADLNGGKAVDYTGKTFTALFYGALAVETVDENELAEIFNASTDKVTLVVDDKDVIKYAFVEEAAYALVNKIDLNKGTFTLKDATLVDETGKALTFGNTDAGKEKLAAYVNFVDTVEAGDLVKLTASIETGHLVYNVEVLEPVTGTMTVRKNDTTATIGGTTYAVGAMAVKGFATMPPLNASTKDDELKVYTDGKYAVYVTGATGAASQISDNVAYVIEKGKVNTTVNGFTVEVDGVYVLTSDGKTATYAYAANNSYAGFKAYGNVNKGDVLEYVLVDDKIYFRDWSFSETENSDKVDYDANANAVFKQSTQRFGTDLVDGNSYFFFVDDTNKKYSVVNASELKDSAAIVDGTAAFNLNNGIRTVAFGVVKGLGSTVSTSSYAFITSDTYTGVDADGNLVTLVNMTLSTGEAVEGAVVKKGNTPEKGTVMTVATVDGEYTFATTANKLAVGEIKGSTSNVLLVKVTAKGENVADTNVGEQVMFTITEDTQFFYVKDKKLVDAVDLVNDQEVKISVNSNGELLAVYVTVA